MHVIRHSSHLQLVHHTMVVAGVVRLAKVEASNAQEEAPHILGPVAFAGIVAVASSIDGRQHIHHAQRIVQRVAELLVQEVLERLAALVEDAHVGERTAKQTQSVEIRTRIHTVMLCTHECCGLPIGKIISGR